MVFAGLFFPVFLCTCCAGRLSTTVKGLLELNPALGRCQLCTHPPHPHTPHAPPPAYHCRLRCRLRCRCAVGALRCGANAQGALCSDAAVLQVGESLCVAACTMQPNPTFDIKEGA